MRVAAPANCTGRIGFKNEGYWGIDVRVQPYNGSFWVKGAYNGSFTATLGSNLTDDVFGSVEVASRAVDGEWTEHNFVITPERAAPSSNNTFGITFNPERTASGGLEFNLISLFPPTWKGRKNGLRVDIAQALADMNPVSCVQSHIYLLHPSFRKV
jgi:alpha-N-arabinofuranosidase